MSEENKYQPKKKVDWLIVGLTIWALVCVVVILVWFKLVT